MKMFEVVENWALHAFADGELEGEERKAMEKLLAENDEARKALSAINYQKSELRKAFGSLVDEPVPFSLLAAIQGRSGRRFLPFAAMAASVALVLIGSAGGWYAAQHSESIQAASLERRALIAHEVFSVEVKHPYEVAAAEQDHLQKWLSKRVGAEVKIPDLNSEGFSLLGGRLLAGENSPAGQLMYETADKQRLTVFISANEDGKNEALRLEEHGNLITCYWRDGKLAMAVTGEMAKDDMIALAKNIYEQMDKRS
jgi:anti-sigma factor RsiW